MHKQRAADTSKQQQASSVTSRQLHRRRQRPSQLYGRCRQNALNRGFRAPPRAHSACQKSRGFRAPPR
eukprot:COSAG02_NODE_49082_length_329_cov_0.843478_1_plen_67_part_01